MRRLALGDLRDSVTWPTTLVFVGTVVLPIAFGVTQTQGSAFRGNFDIYQQLMNSPAIVALPLIAVLLGCGPTYREVGNRFVANTRMRMDVRQYLAAKLAAATVLPFAALFLWSFAAIVLAFVVWPRIGNPSVMPEVYGMTPQQAIADSIHSVSYSSLLADGPLAFGLAYSAWLGFGGAIYAVIGVLALVVVRNRLLALSVPLAIYLGETVAASLLGSPTAALMFSLFPFGLEQASTEAAATPTVTLAVATAFAVAAAFVRFEHLDRLT